jgi:hypothetical protein
MPLFRLWKRESKRKHRRFYFGFNGGVAPVNKVFLEGVKMKKVIFGLMVLAVFCFMGCPTDTDEEGTATTKFEGAWVNVANAKYVFTNYNWRLVRPGREDASGTLIFTENPNRIIFTATAGSSGSWTYTYEFKNDNSTLNLTGSNGPASSTGDFMKQPYIYCMNK